MSRAPISNNTIPCAFQEGRATQPHEYTHQKREIVTIRTSFSPFDRFSSEDIICIARLGPT